MGYDYSFYGDMDVGPFVEGAFAGVGGFVLVFMLLFYLLMFAFCIVSYVLQSVGLHAIAKRRGIKNPWLCWLPLGDAWILGSISDQYNYVAKGKVKNKRKVLLGLSIGSMAVVLPLLLVAFIGLILSDTTGGEGFLGAMIALMLVAYLAMIVMLVIVAVFRYIALYDLFNSCNPDNAVAYLILGIFIAVTTPFFIFACRDKDWGMPPRKQEPVIDAEPMAEPEDFE